MRYNKLGSTDIEVSEICLGSMTWGVQNSEEEGHEQMDYAISRGVNFIDTAELYPSPTTVPEYVSGETERVIGSYLAKHPDLRPKLVIATKVVGYMTTFGHITTLSVISNRTDPPGSAPKAAHVDEQSVIQACEGSLRRLQTDYIDLYQLHWPDRYVPSFGHRMYDPTKERDAVPMRDTLMGFKRLLDAGKIRAWGLSNETTFGVCEAVRTADALGMARPATIQNSFCLMDRRFETELAEACAPRNFNIGLLPWSILAGGMLTGKFSGCVNEESGLIDKCGTLGNARLVKYTDYQERFRRNVLIKVSDMYAKVAKKHGMSPATMAHAFCKSRWYIPSTIIGATSMEQLKENIDAFEVELSEEVLADIDEIHHLNKDCIIVN